MKLEFKNIQYLYTYQYKDHLGNVRLTYRDGYKNHATQENVKDGIIQVTEIIDQTDYYPFGLKHNNNALADYSAVNKYKYAYNGKELNDELGVDLYDFGARNYDPALGRWLNVDPLAENSRRWTPYNYAYNNPIYFIDPDGMQSVSSIKTDDLLDDIKDKLTFSNGYYDTEFGKSAVAAEHNGFYKNSEFNDGGGDTDPPNLITFTNKNDKTIATMSTYEKSQKIQLDTDFSPVKILNININTYVKYDAIGFNLGYSGTVGGGMEGGFSVMYFLKGPDSGKIGIYSFVGGNVGFGGGIEFGIVGSIFNKNLSNKKDFTVEGFNGGYNGYSIQTPIGSYSYSWSNTKGTTDEIYRNHRYPTTWTSYSFGNYGGIEGKFSGGTFELLRKINLNK